MKTILITAASVAALAGCATPAVPMFMQDGLPDAVKVPAGFKVALETSTSAGEITYECRAKASAAGEFEWFFVGPKAGLNDRGGKAVGKYYGPPATWEAMDGSKITGMQLAVAPAGAGNIPSQLVKANAATSPMSGAGMMVGISHVQRVATKGGVAPALPCNAGALGQKQVVSYSADYIFYKPV